MAKRFFTIFISAALVLLCNYNSMAQVSKIFSKILGNPSSAEIEQGIKQALELGTSKSSDRLSATNGYFGNLAIKLVFPDEAKKVETRMRALGLNKLCDNVILSLNRAAEDAAKEAKPIFVSAIKQMTLKDATNILLANQNDAATEYFKRVTSQQLQEKFSPIIKNSLAKVGATKYWGDVITQYNKIPLVTDVNPDLAAYTTQKAMDGLFKEIAGEELKIRQNLSSRNTALLQKVFSYADKNKVK